MKRLTIFYVLLVSLLLSSCGNWEDHRSITRLRELSMEYPDSALFLLDVSLHPRLMNDKNLAEWCMLNAQLRDTLGKDIDVDTLFLRQTVSYFTKQKQVGAAAGAALYWGRALAYFNRYNSATPVYLWALEQAKSINDDNLAGYISSYLADLYHEEWNYAEAQKLYKQASEYFLKAGNIRSYGMALGDLGLMSVMRGEEDISLKYTEMADSITSVLKDTKAVSYITNSIGIIYKEMEKNDLAKDYFFRSINLDSMDNSSNYIMLSEIYVKEGKIDSAEIYLNKFDKNHDIYNQASFEYQKYELYKSLHQVDSAMVYLESYVESLDSIWTEQDELYISEIGKKYDYSKMEDENRDLLNRKYNQFIWIFILAFIVLLLYILYRRKSIRAENKQLALELETAERKRQELELKQKELELKSLKEREAQMRKDLMKRSLMFKKIQLLSEYRIKKPKEFKEEIEKIFNSATLSESDWQEIKEEINYAYPGFTDKLVKVLPQLTEEEIRFCYLLKSGLDTCELANLLHIHGTSVDKRRYRINQKIKDNFPDMDWKEFLSTLGQKDD